MLKFDCETNGLLEVLDRIHCLVIKDTQTGAVTRYNEQPGTPPELRVEVGVRRLQGATENRVFITGHNVIKFDVVAIRKVYPWFNPVSYYVLDTMVIARLIYPDLHELDSKLKAKGSLPPKLYKKHTLEAWGYRCGNYKGDFTGPWDEWTQEMEDYCVQDVEVTDTLDTRFRASRLWPGQDSINLEHAVQWVLARQERHGFLFDSTAAGELYRKLAKRRIELEAELTAKFKPFYIAGSVKTAKKAVRHQVEELGLDPKRPIYEGKGKDKRVVGHKFRTQDTAEGATYQVVKLTTFNPASRPHVANRLTKLYGWKPTEFTAGGEPEINDTILTALPYPEAPTLAAYYLVAKRIGALAEGKHAWMKYVKEDGRIHGAVNPNGAVTGRMTHAFPPMGTIPATRSEYGTECRACFIVPPGKKLVGADADALELRCLGHYMAKYDGGEYVVFIVRGKKSEGNDAHSVNARAIGLDPKAIIRGLESGRDITKTWFYAFIYGAGNEKLGLILIGVKGKKAALRGKKSRDALMAELPALKTLIDAVQKMAKASRMKLADGTVVDKPVGHIKGLDGRWVRVRADHAALNTLLQHAGAVIMKMALVILDNNLQKELYVPGINYEFVANIHDEWQIECDEAIAEEVGRMAVDAIRLAGEHYNFRCPLTGGYSVGRTWADTH